MNYILKDCTSFVRVWPICHFTQDVMRGLMLQQKAKCSTHADISVNGLTALLHLRASTTVKCLQKRRHWSSVIVNFKENLPLELH